MNFFKILMIINLISSWMKKALEDGKITLDEALDLISMLAEQLGLTLEFNVADVLAGPEKKAAITPDESATLEFPETSEVKDTTDAPIIKGDVRRGAP